MKSVKAIISQALDCGISEAVLKSAVKNFGNGAKIKSFADKARAGAELTVGFFGGSVTAGSNSTDGKCYANNVTDFLKTQFPDAKISKINAGKGATGSLVGVYRMEEELLCHNPDLIFIDFSVNDALEELRDGVIAKEAYEGVVRKAVASGAAVVLLCVCNEQGLTHCELHNKIGAHYSLPVVSMVDSIYQLIKSGEMKWTDYSNDSVHPINYGHKLLSLIIEYHLATVFSADNETEAADIPKPVFSDCYKAAVMYDFDNAELLSRGDFKAFDGFGQFCRGFASCGLEPMSYKMKNARELHLIILYSPDAEMGAAEVEVNGKPQTVSCKFEGGWGEKALAVNIFSSDIPQDVTVNIRPKSSDKKFVVLRICKA